jgi:hypothetical protein
VTLLIKSCAQDAGSLAEQVRHLVGSLCASTRFALRALLIDTHRGPYLRQHVEGDLSSLIEQAKALQREGWLDEIWIYPADPGEVSALGQVWFGVPGATRTHTTQGAPLFPQLWGFEQVRTRFVLQLDVDVLVGIADSTHDVVGDMKCAMADPGVWCVGFNIPKAEGGFRPYESRAEGYAPEVRMGLLDLSRILSRRPFDNPVINGRHTLMWHRALEQAQRSNGMCSVRGGDSRSFYVHPRNPDKSWAGLAMARDLIGQGLFPPDQAEQWDLVISASWAHRRRHEDLVFMLLGRDTPPAKLTRCLASLAMQTRQEFGVVLIDDGGICPAVHSLHHSLGRIRDRTTLIRRNERVGYVANFRAVAELCSRADTLIVVLDQDDALMNADVAECLWQAWSRGADLINAPMFRPDKPVKLYPVTYDHPRRCGGGNVWAHLRAFRKSLFEGIQTESLNAAPDEIDCLNDFLTMVPMAELAEHPVALDDRYAYLHEREPYPQERKKREEQVKAWLFSQPELSRMTSGAAAEPE